MASTDGHTAEIVRSYLDVWNNREYSEIPSFVSETFILHDPAAPEEGVPGPDSEVHGREGLQQFIEMATTGFPDFEIEISDMIVTDKLVMWEGTHGGTHEGEFAGLPPTGHTFRTPHASVVRLNDGLVQEHRAYFDPAVSAEQLGMTFPSIIAQAPKLVVRKLQSRL